MENGENTCSMSEKEKYNQSIETTALLAAIQKKKVFAVANEFSSNTNGHLIGFLLKEKESKIQIASTQCGSLSRLHHRIIGLFFLAKQINSYSCLMYFLINGNS